MNSEVEVPVTDIKQENKAEVRAEERTTSFTKTLRKMLLATVGAMAMSRDELEQFVNRLIERGEIAEREGRQLIREVLERRKRQAEQTEGKLESEAESRLYQVLNRLNIPTKRDMDELSEKIAQLSERIEQLQRERQAQE